MRRLGQALRVPQDRQFAVFLTPDGRSPTSSDSTRWQTVSYGAIYAEFSRLLPSHTFMSRSSSLWRTGLDHFNLWRYAMSWLSEESLLLVENWETVVAILEPKNG